MNKKGIKQFNKCNLALVLLLIIEMLILLLTVNKLVGLIIFALSYFLYQKIKIKLQYKYVYSILYDDLDAKKYYDETMKKSKFALNTSPSITANWFVGNYKYLEEFLTNEMSMAKGNQAELFAFCLKYVYFETNNLEKMREIHDFAKEMDLGIVNDFFIHYVNEEFELCLKECDKIEDWVRNQKNKHVTFEMVRINFMRAVVYYRLGEFDKARELFENITQTAPNMQYADISQNYLKAIETGDNHYISSEVLFVDKCAVTKSIKREKRRPLLVATAWIAVIMALIFILWGFGLNDTEKDPDFTIDKINTMFNVELRNYLDDTFENWSILGDYYFEQESIFVVESTNSLNIVGYVFEFEGDEVTHIDFKVYATDIEFNKLYESTFCYDNSKVKFIISDSYYNLSPETLYVEQIEIDGLTYYFAIVNVRSYEERYAEAFNDTMTYAFGKYTVCGKYYSKDDNIQSDVYVIKTNDGIHIVGFYFKIDELDKTENGCSVYTENAEFDQKYSSKVFGYEGKLSFLITESRDNISEDVFSVNEIVIDGNVYYFAIGDGEIE